MNRQDAKFAKFAKFAKNEFNGTADERG